MKLPAKPARLKQLFIFITFIFAFAACRQSRHAIVFQTDFGLKDGAVSEMKGVAYAINPELSLYDLTHEIPAYNVWEAAYRLYQTAPYWPAGTVFVSVVDPGVGTKRRSVVMKSRSGQFFATPDNGTLTLVAESLGIEAVREIDERINRRRGSDSSYTFHGRDVYAFTAARLAAGIISFEQVGELLSDSIVKLNYQQPVYSGDSIIGNIPVLDVQYGNVWTNINDGILRKLNIRAGDKLRITILHKDSIVYHGVVSFARTFGDVQTHQPLGYQNSLMNFSLAINEGNFADSMKIQSGPSWNVIIKKVLKN